MSNKIKIGIIGLGNCAGSLIQGLEYYKDKDEKNSIGLAHWDLGGYKISDIEVTTAFDVDSRKVGKDVSKAIFYEPNCTKIFIDNVPNIGVEILKGPILDGVSPHMTDYFIVDKNQRSLNKDEIINKLQESNTQILINYVPVGSQKLTEFWAQIALDSNCAFINCIPCFIASNKEWANKFTSKNIPVLGDDIKSQVGATILNRCLVQMILDRGGIIDNSFQINIGGNGDFNNMTNQSRLVSKKISKTESISSQIPYYNNGEGAYIWAGPNGYIKCLNDNKLAYTRIDFKIFGNIPCSIDCKLSVEDSPNSAGIVIDAIRCTKIALDRNIGGPLISPSALYMKHPPKQYKDEIAHQLVEDFIKGNIDN